jgi:ParB family chromosome partitioning protein
MQVPVNEIKTKNRIRKDMGDIEALADSMNRIGQINPIVITEDHTLLAGGRRLAAAKFLGWRTINAIIARLPDGVSALEVEIEENDRRLDFNEAESQNAKKRLYRLRHPWFWRRLWDALVRLIKRLFKR